MQNARRKSCGKFAYARKNWLDMRVRELRIFI
jgi:hypothetical protein